MLSGNMESKDECKNFEAPLSFQKMLLPMKILDCLDFKKFAYKITIF